MLDAVDNEIRYDRRRPISLERGELPEDEAPPI